MVDHNPPKTSWMGASDNLEFQKLFNDFSIMYMIEYDKSNWW